MENLPTPAQDFVQTGISAALLTALAKNNITAPTPIQAQAIPVAMEGKDVMGIAETGTGKTLAFSLPILHRFGEKPGLALIVVPTRELALQVEEGIRKVIRFLPGNLRTVCLIGGMAMYQQKQGLRAQPNFIVATPGRLLDHVQQRTVNLGLVSTVVLDEADRMFDMGFAPAIKRILEQTPPSRQTLCFSATMAPEIASLANVYMRQPVMVKVSGNATANVKIDQELAYVRNDGKVTLLHQVLTDHPGRILVFTRTKHGAKRLTEQLRAMEHKTAEIHSNRSLGQRRQALDGFKTDRYRVLVATDVAARGIDVQDIALVVNFDLPDASEDYVHRIGRTGRAGKTGKTIAFATPDQVRDVRNIERLLKMAIPLSKYSQQAPQSFSNQYSAPRRFQRNGVQQRSHFQARNAGAPSPRRYDNRDAQPSRYR